jgi:hypothetical protein
MTLSNVAVIGVVVNTPVGPGVDVSGTVENTFGKIVKPTALVVKFHE